MLYNMRMKLPKPHVRISTNALPLLLILGIGLVVGGIALLSNVSKSVSVSAQQPLETYSSKDMGITFTYPKGWTIVDDSGRVAYIYRLHSPDYAETKTYAGTPNGYTGTMVTIFTSKIDFTLAEDRAAASAPTNLPKSIDFQDFNFKGHKAFRYTSEAYGGLGASFTTEIDVWEKNPVKIIFQPAAESAQPDKYRSAYDGIVGSVTFL